MSNVETKPVLKIKWTQAKDYPDRTEYPIIREADGEKLGFVRLTTKPEGKEHWTWHYKPYGGAPSPQYKSRKKAVEELQDFASNYKVEDKLLEEGNNDV